MFKKKKKITFDSFIRGIITLLLVVGVLYLLKVLSGVLLPFFIAWVIAYLSYPLVRFFQYRLRLRIRILSILCTLLLIGGVIGVALWLLVPPMIAELTKLKDLIVIYLINSDHISSVPNSLTDFIHNNIDLQWIHQHLFSGENLEKTLKEMVPRLWNLLSGSLNMLLNIFASFIVILYVVFILVDYEQITDGCVKLFPPNSRHTAHHILTDLKEAMNKYFRGQALIAFTVGILFSIGFLIIDFPLAIGFGLFIGLLNMVPYLQLIALIPTILLALLKAADTGQNFWWIMFCALMVFVIVQIIQDGFLTPKIMGRVTGLNPAIILLSLSVWSTLLGVLGLIIALPLTSLLISYYQKYIVAPRERMTGEVAETDEPNSA